MNLIYPSNKTLYPFQVEAIEKTINFLETNPTNSCYNACEMGLGKTVQAIVALNTLGYQKVLVVCPAIMRLVWAEEIKAWSEPLSPTYTILKGKDITSMFKVYWDWLITSYDLASKSALLRYLEEMHFDAIIMDEFHYLKNSKAKRTKTVLQKLWPRAKYHLALSGTPCQTEVIDLYTACHRMLPIRFVDFTSFTNEFSYCRIKYISGRSIHEYYGIKNAPVLKDIIRSNFYVRYLVKDCLKELPPVQYTKITLPESYGLTPKEHSLELEQEVSDVVRAIEAGKEPAPISEHLATIRRLLGERKTGAIIEFAQHLLEQGICLVIFSWHKSVIKLLSEAFRKYRPSVITGETPALARGQAVDAFQRGDTLLFIGNFIASGVGISLFRSATVILAETAWTPNTISQAVARCARIGQKSVVNAYYFVVEKSLDEAIMNILMTRVKDFKKVLD